MLTIIRRVHNFTSVREMYQWSSSVNYMKDIRTPMIFINAKDDPLVPEPMLTPVRNFAGNFCLLQGIIQSDVIV